VLAGQAGELLKLHALKVQTGRQRSLNSRFEMWASDMLRLPPPHIVPVRLAMRIVEACRDTSPHPGDEFALATAQQTVLDAAGDQVDPDPPSRR
jgi:hypothetical protein